MGSVADSIQQKLVAESEDGVAAGGTVTSPGVTTNIVSLVIPKAGRYRVTAAAWFGAVGDIGTNCQLKVSGIGKFSLPVQAAANGVPVPVVMEWRVSGGALTIAIATIAAGAAGCVYNAFIHAVRIAD